MDEKSNKSRGMGKHKWLLIAGAVLGVVLILLGNGNALFGDKATEKTETASAPDELAVYTEAVEKKIRTLCEGVGGVSDVRVIVTFAGDFSYVYATDGDVTEKDGVREDRSEYVTVGSGSSEQAVLLTRTPPSVCGIGIVCRGATSGARQEIIALLSATFGIGSNKIYVAEANS